MSLDANQRQLEKSIRHETPGLLKGMAGDKKKQLIEFLQAKLAEAQPGQVVMATQSQITTSPVPPAELLEGYNATIPNGAERLFTLVEGQSAHRQSIETKVVDAQAKRSDRGQIFAFILAIVFAGLAAYFGAIGQAWLAGEVLTVTIGAIITTFIMGQKNQQQNLDKKAPGKPAKSK